MTNEIILFDTEFTSWEGAQERNWSGENEYKEIIQVGAVKMDLNSGAVTETLNISIKPTLNPILSDYIKDLTGITQEEVDNGLNLQTATLKFLHFCSGNPVFSWGRDIDVVNEDLSLKNLPTIPDENFFNLRDWLVPRYPEFEKANSGSLARLHNLDGLINGKEHDAIYDCLSQQVVLSEDLKTYKDKQDFRAKFNLN